MTSPTTQTWTPLHDNALEKLKRNGDWRTAKQHNLKRRILLDLVCIGMARYRIVDTHDGKEIYEFRGME